MPAGLQLPAVSVPQSLCQQREPKLNAPKGEFQNFLQCMLLSYVRKFSKAITVLKIFGYHFSTNLKKIREGILCFTAINISVIKFLKLKIYISEIVILMRSIIHSYRNLHEA
jgi:hypothetical protein